MRHWHQVFKERGPRRGLAAGLVGLVGLGMLSACSEGPAGTANVTSSGEARTSQTGASQARASLSPVAKEVASRYVYHEVGGNAFLYQKRLAENGQVASQRVEAYMQYQALSWTIEGGMTAIPLPPAYNSTVAANSAGQVLGIHGQSGQWGMPFLWSEVGGVQFLPLPGEGPAEALDMNAQGQVVGSIYRTREPFITSVSGVQVIPTPDGSGGRATRINDAGQVLGDYHALGEKARLYLWSAADGSIDVPAPAWLISPDPEDAYYLVPLALNASGQVLGKMYQSRHLEQYFVWSPQGETQVIERLERPEWGSDSMGVSAMNQAGQVVGTSRGWPYIWSASTGTRKLQGPDGDIYYGSAVAVNDVGQVAGSAILREGESARAVIWTEAGEMIDLNERIDPALGLTLTTAHNITNSGYIAVGASGSGRVGLLVPQER